MLDERYLVSIDMLYESYYLNNLFFTMPVVDINNSRDIYFKILKTPEDTLYKNHGSNECVYCLPPKNYYKQFKSWSILNDSANSRQVHWACYIPYCSFVFKRTRQT